MSVGCAEVGNPHPSLATISVWPLGGETVSKCPFQWRMEGTGADLALALALLLMADFLP